MLLVFSLCSLFGLQTAARLKQRARLLAELQSAVRRLMLRMEYGRKPLAELVSEQAHGRLAPLWKTFAAELRCGADTRRAFALALAAADAEIAGFSLIGEEARALLLSFAAALGGAELDGERQNAAMLLAGLEPLREQAENECLGKGKVCRAVGVLTGAAIVICML